MFRLVTMPAAGLLAIAALTTVAPAAQASTYTSTGVRCTRVGTPGSDWIVGTDSRDVICGLGGNDVIFGGGGSDLLDGGAGRDELYGQDGSDRLFGGYGDDYLVGAAQNDVMVGGAGADAEMGGTGDDRGFGGDGMDSLAGDAGKDTLSGGTGADSVNGGADADTLNGGDQADTVNGGTGADVVATGAGDDLINGGAGADNLDGQAGFNICNYDGLDTRTRCVYDQSAPHVEALELSATSVDVTDNSAVVTIRVHVTDDTGIAGVGVGLDSSLVSAWVGPDGNGGTTQTSGSPRDGWFETAATIQRYAPGGDFTVSVQMVDRIGRHADTEYPGALTVTDNNPDNTEPTVTAVVKPASSASYDVRQTGATVTVQVHIADDKSGADPQWFCLTGPEPGVETGFCDYDPALVSGSSLDGVWQARIDLPEDSLGGIYGFSVYLTDRAHGFRGINWFDVRYGSWLRSINYGRQLPTETAELPDGAGNFSVVGSFDNNPPIMTSLSSDRSSIDTLGSAQTVHFTVTATDVEGVTSVELQPDQNPWTADGPQLDRAYLTLTSGTPKNGTWEGDVVFPQGTPPGDYPLWVAVIDKSHGAMYASSSHPSWDGPTALQVIPGDADPKITVVSSQ